MPVAETASIFCETICFNAALKDAVKDAKAGKVDYRTEKGSLLHIPIGKVSFDSDKLFENAQTVIKSVVKAKPSSSKGKYLKKVVFAIGADHLLVVGQDTGLDGGRTGFRLYQTSRIDATFG